MAPGIVVINPNSSERITEQIRDAVHDATTTVVTSPGGPEAIETDEDVAAAVEPLLATALGLDASAYVVACFSDPGLDQLREQSDIPAFGIAESAIQAATRVGSRIGVISSVDDSIPRHERYWAKLGVSDRIVADIPLGLGVLELDTEDAYEAALSAGRSLIDSGADVVVLGCTGMTHMEHRLEAALGVPVVDPCRAAVELAKRSVAALP